jgi:hypothetical protein
MNAVAQRDDLGYAAELLRRTLDFDVFACVRCGGRLN